MSKFNAKIGRGGFEKQLSHSASDSRQVSLLLPALAVVRVCLSMTIDVVRGVLVWFGWSLINFTKNKRINVVRGF